MARMHSRKKGSSGTTRPVKKAVPSWLRYKAKEIEMLVLKLAKDGKTASQIGMLLRDMYGIPDVKLMTKKSISAILQEKKLAPAIPDDLTALIRKRIVLQKHFEDNHKDMPAKRGLRLTDSKINRLVKYYKKSGKLALDWKFNPKQATMFVD